MLQFAVVDPRTQTEAVIALLLVALAATTRPASRTEAFPKSLTTQVKGFAILAVVFAHLGYGLAADNAFLWPLSVLGGVAVNLFLFLSGLGLTRSAEQRSIGALAFYRRRLAPIFIPLWLVLAVGYTADFLLQHRTYAAGAVIGSFAGFFPSAVLATDFDSPLWYLTLLLAYYVAFPWLYRRGRPWLSAILLGAAGVAFTYAAAPFVGSTVWLFWFHLAAFPLGALAAHATLREPLQPLPARWQPAVRQAGAAVCAAVLAVTAVHSAVGTHYEQAVSVVTTLSVVGLFLLLPVEFGLFTLFGTYSYEIYLVHWPLLSRYDFFFTAWPPWAATAAWLVILPALGWALQALLKRVVARAAAKPVKAAAPVELLASGE